MFYVRALRSFSHTAHISRQTRDNYFRTIVRSQRDQGVVLPLGADGVVVERQNWSRKRKKFLAIGSIDGRKNQKVIAEAFRMLRAKGHDVELTIIGRAFENQDVGWLRETAQVPGFRWISDASDEMIADAYREARATIYVSEAEGYGLPPVESLWAGVPVIAPADMPSLAGLEPLGQVRLPTVSPDTIAAAMLDLMKDPVATRLWNEAAQLQLPTWRDFARDTVDWLNAA